MNSQYLKIPFRTYFANDDAQFVLYFLFIGSIFFSGTSLFIVHISHWSINLSPSNLILSIAIAGSLIGNFRHLQSVNRRPSIPQILGHTVVESIKFQRSLRWVWYLFIILWGMMFVSLLKDSPPSSQVILTGISGLGSFWFTAKSINSIEQIEKIAKLFVTLAVITALLTTLASADILGIRSIPLVTTPNITIESFLPGFDRDVIFGFGSDTLGAIMIIAIATLLWRVSPPSHGHRFKLQHGFAFSILLFTSAIIQSRGTWIALLVFGLFFAVLSATRGKYSNFRRPAIISTILFIVIGFVFIANAIGGAQDGVELNDRYARYGAPTLFGVEIPREFVYNAALRLKNYDEAWQIILNSPIQGAPSELLQTYNGHSTYVDLVMLAGIIPLILLALIFFLLFRLIINQDNMPYSWVDVSASLVLALLITNLFHFGIFQKYVLIIVAIIIMMQNFITKSNAGPSADDHLVSPELP